MALTTYTADTAVIAALADEPNETDGLTAAQYKAKFDKGMTDYKAWFNATHIPELDAVHLPYDYTVVGGQTVKEAVDEAVLGTIPDSTITAAKFASSAYNSEAEAEAGTAETGIMNPLRVAQAVTAQGLKVQSGTLTNISTSATAALTGTPAVVFVRYTGTTLSKSKTAVLLDGDTQMIIDPGSAPQIAYSASLSGTTLTVTCTDQTDTSAVFNYVSLYV